MFPTAHLIKEIGRGSKGARSITQIQARELFAAILAGQVSDLELGALLLAMRIKGESLQEIAGFSQALESSLTLLQAPPSEYAPIVIPSYNGARRMANLTPLLACLLARAGAPVLVHGVVQDAGRVTSAEIFQAMGLAHCADPGAAEQQLAAHTQQPVFIAIEQLAPRAGQLLALRRQLGVRNSTHTLVKILQPFVRPAVRLACYTHPEYLTMLSDYFTTLADPARGDVLLMRGTEGEAVANINKVQAVNLFHAGQQISLQQAEQSIEASLIVPPDLQGTAGWIQSVLDGHVAVPENIARQVAQILAVARQLNSRETSA